MADEELAADTGVLAPTGAEQQQEAPEPEIEIEGEGDQESVEEDVDELEFGFKKYQVPKSLKAGIEDWRKTTTQKEQSIAAEARTLAQQRAQQAQASEAELDARADLRAINAQLADYAKLTPQDWFSHQQQDPMGVQQAQLTLQMLRDRKAELEGTVRKAHDERTAAASGELDKRVQETLAHAAKQNIKPERIGELVKFAGEIGVPESVIRTNWSPQFLDLLHLANIGKSALTKAKASKPPATPAEPLQTVRPRGATARPGLHDDLSSEEWTRRRNKQIADRARAR